jgi:hypothetical protein
LIILAQSTLCSYWVIKIAEDMNGDGRFTISDVGLWTKYFFFFPGDSLIVFLTMNFPTFTEFVEVGPNWCHGVLSGVFGVFVWGFCLLIGLGLLSTLREILDKWAPIKHKPY